MPVDEKAVKIEPFDHMTNVNAFCSCTNCSKIFARDARNVLDRVIEKTLLYDSVLEEMQEISSYISINKLLIY